MSDDLNTQLVFGANTAGAEAGVRTVRRSLKELADSATAAGKSVEESSNKASKGLAGMGDGGESAARKLQRDTASMKSSLQRYLSTLEGGSKDSRKYWESMADFKGVDKNALRPLLDQLDAYKSKTVAASESTVAWSSNLTKIGAGVAGIAAVTASAGVAAKAMFDASASAERLRTMLDFSTGGNSAKEIDFLRGVTYRLGLEFASTARAYGQFQAAAKGTALEGDKARAVFESVAKASAVMGLSASDTSGVLLALQQMISKGTVQAEELRGQLGERLPGAFQVAAKAMGVTTAELGKMLEQGQVVADDFLPKFGRALEENLGGAAEKAAQRLDAAVNRFDTAWEKLKQRAGDSGVSKAVAGELGAITRDLEAVTDGMDRAGRAGGGMWAQFGAAGAIAAGRVGFSTLNLAANSLNGAINALTGGVFGLRTDLALLPDVFKTDAQYAEALAQRLKSAEAEMAALQGTGASTSENIYIRSSYVQLQEYIKELKAAQAEQAKLTGGPAPISDAKETFLAQERRAREAANAQRAKDEEAANKFRLNLAGVPDGYVKEMTELIRLNEAGIIVGKEYTDALKKQQDELLKKTGAVKSSNAAANQEQNAYESLISSIRAKIEADNLEIAGGAALTESQRIRIKLDQDLAAGRVKLGSLREADVRRAIEELAVSEAAAEAQKALAKAQADATADRMKVVQSMEASAASVQTQNDALREEIELIGLSAAQQTQVLQQRNEAIILTKEATLAELERQSAVTGTQTRVEIALAAEIAALKERNKLLGAKGVKNAAVDAAKTAKDEWQRTADDINRSLTEALMRGFESGKGFAENLRDTVSNMFSTLVLRPIISAAMSPVAGAINGMLYGNAAAAVGGGANALGMLGSGANLISGLQGTSGMLGTVGGWLGLNTVATNAGLAATIGIDAASAAAAANAAGAAGGGLLSGVGAALPWIGGIAAVASILGGLDDSGTYHTGGAAQYSGARGLRTSLGFRDNEEGLPSYNPNDNIDNQFGTGFGYVERGDQTISAVSTIAQGLGTALDGIAVAFGQTAGYEIATAFADDTSKDGAWGALRISKEGQELLNWEDTRTSRWAPREFGDGEEGYKQYLAAVAKDTRQVLLDMDLPSWADDMLESIGESASMEQLTGVLTQIGVVQSAFVSLGKSMAMFADLTDEMQSGLLTAAGSIDALTAGAGAFYQGFYSEQERVDAVVAQLNETLAGLDLSIDPTLGDDAKAQFRAAVEAAFAAGDAELAAGLLSISGNFATAADYFEQAAEAQAQAAEAQAQAAKESADVQIKAAQDAARAIAEAYESALERIGSTRFDLQNQLLTQSGQGQYAQQLVDQRDLAELTKGLPEDQAAKVREQFEANIKLRDQYAANQLAIDNLAKAMEEMERQQNAAAQAQRSMLQGTVTSAQNAVSQLKSIFDTLDSSIASLRGSVASAAEQDSRAAREYIAQASVLMRSGSVVDAGRLQAAVRSATAGIDNQQFANSNEADFERLKLAGELAGLKDSTAGQLTVAEQHLSIAESQLAALEYIASSISSLAGAQQAAAGQPRDQWATVSGQQVYASSGGAVGLNTGSDIDIYGKDGSRFTGSEAIALVRNQLAANDEMSVYAAAVRTGISSKALDELMGWQAGTSSAWAELNKLPKFEGGGWHAGGLRVVGERGWEVEATGPARYWNQQQLANAMNGGGSAALEEEVRAMRAELAQLRAVTQAVAEAAGATADVLVRVTNNGNGMVTAAAPL